MRECSFVLNYDIFFDKVESKKQKYIKRFVTGRNEWYCNLKDQLHFPDFRNFIPQLWNAANQAISTQHDATG